MNAIKNYKQFGNKFLVYNVVLNIKDGFDLDSIEKEVRRYEIANEQKIREDIKNTVNVMLNSGEIYKRDTKYYLKSERLTFASILS